jgi:hypothetical protein
LIGSIGKFEWEEGLIDIFENAMCKNYIFDMVKFEWVD